MTLLIDDLIKKTDDRISNWEAITDTWKEAIVWIFDLAKNKIKKFLESVDSSWLSDTNRLEDLLSGFNDEIVTETSKAIDLVFSIEKLTFDTEEKIKKWPIL